MDERMTLERIKPTHWMDDLGRVCTAEFMASDKAHGDYQLAYRIPCVKQGRKFVRIDDAHLTQPAQAVDVRSAVVKALGGYLERHWPDNPVSYDDMADHITRAIGNAQAEGWRPIETALRGSRKVIALISNAGPNGYVTDPWTGWIESDGKVARWPHPFPPTHWMPLPTPPTQATPNAHE